MSENQTVYDLAGIGAGPSNLSLAALLQKTTLSRIFFERQQQFRWHPEQMFKNSFLTVPSIKDLVSLVDPTNPFSFNSFLVQTRRVYEHIVAGFENVYRKEFEQYLRWVAESIPEIHLATPIESVEFVDDFFVLRGPELDVRARNLAFGVGRRPAIPHCAKPFLGDRVFHCCEFLNRSRSIGDKRIAIVGGGQSGAEIALYLLEQNTQQCTWITRRFNFHPLDESPFANELFFPGFQRYFSQLPFRSRENLRHSQKLASDGITTPTLMQIYRHFYRQKYVQEDPTNFTFTPAWDLVKMSESPTGLRLELRSSLDSDHRQELEVDVVVLCTGYEEFYPDFLEPMRHRIDQNDYGLKVDEHWRVRWDGPKENNIYALTGASRRMGIAEPNLGLIAWRSANIINHISGHAVYDTTGFDGTVDWSASGYGAPSTQKAPRESVRFTSL